MRCDAVKLMIDDFLDKTISVKKAVIVEEHLGHCESCRDEFEKLQRADALLRKTVVEMVSQIEVPADLNGRIKEALARERARRPWMRRLPPVLRSPAFAAVLLVAVAFAGIFGMHGLFNRDARRTDVVMQEPGIAYQSEAGDAYREELKKSQVPEENLADRNIAQENGRLLQFDGITPGYGEAGPGAGQEKGPDSQAAAPARQSLPMEDEKRGVAGTGEPSPSITEKLPMSINRAQTLKKGTLEEAARENDFSPARPSYLPGGAELQDVSWSPGQVCQSYRSGGLHFKIVQGRPDLMGFNYEEELRQGGKPVLINGLQAVLQQNRFETEDGAAGTETSVRWTTGGWTFAVSGGLPPEELIKIASSLK